MDDRHLNNPVQYIYIYTGCFIAILTQPEAVSFTAQVHSNNPSSDSANHLPVSLSFLPTSETLSSVKTTSGLRGTSRWIGVTTWHFESNSPKAAFTLKEELEMLTSFGRGTTQHLEYVDQPYLGDLSSPLLLTSYWDDPPSTASW